MNLKYRFNLTLAQYGQLLTAQGDVCAICKQPERYVRNGKLMPLSVDHNHATGEVRGLLCNRCNRALGLFEDDPEILQRAVCYAR